MGELKSFVQRIIIVTAPNCIIVPIDLA